MARPGLRGGRLDTESSGKAGSLGPHLTTPTTVVSLPVCSPGLPPGKGAAVGEPPARHPRGHCRPLGPGSDEALGRPFSMPTLTPPQQHSSPEPEAGAAFCSPPLQVRWRVLGLACRALRGSLWTPHPSPCPRLAPAQHQPSQDTHHPFGQLHVDPLGSTACLSHP